MACERRHEIVLCWSERDGAFIAEVPDLPGCTVDGRTYAGALKAVEIAVEERIQTAMDLGRPIPAPQGRRAATA